MEHITDQMVEACVDATAVEDALADAMRSFSHGHAAMQGRVRTQSGSVKLSTLGAVLPQQGVAGAKVYTTINGQFSFVVILFSTADGRPLATFDAGAITRHRTATCSLIASRFLARPQARRLALFGLGVQGRSHAVLFASRYALEEIRVCDPYVAPTAIASLRDACGISVRVCGPHEAVSGADIVVTASRSQVPLFSGEELAAGTFIAAIGSSLPGARELDDACLARASRIAVDWSAQAMEEAGDLVMAAQDALSPRKLVELSDLVAGRAPGRTNDSEVTVYKAVGVGLQDVAIAGLVWRTLKGPRSE